MAPRPTKSGRALDRDLNRADHALVARFHRAPGGVLARVSQTTVYDTGGSATAVALVGWVFRS